MKGTNLKKTRLIKSKSQQGLDGLTFELILQGDLKNLEKQPLINEFGRKYGHVEVRNGNAIVVLVLPKFIRDDNIQAFSILDSIMLEVIKNDVEVKLTELFGDELDSKIKAIECNVTQRVSGKSNQSDVLRLLNKSTLSTKFDNVLYVGENKRCPYREEVHTVISKRSKYWTLKAYDKSAQQIAEKKKNKQDPCAVPDGLLRIEIAMIDRTIDKLFGSKTSLSDILTKDSLISVLREYKRVFCDEIIEGKVKPYLNICTLQLLQTLCETENPIETIAKEKELIVDKVVLRKAIKKWQRLRGVSDNSSRDAELYAKKFCIPEDVILTLKDFKKACG